ncbi:MAG: DUF4124 domain-containing protein [Woeseiaceae bacterium]|jgi:hypothetical protein
METRPILALLVLLVTPLALAEEAYVWTDENGVIHYSDRPMPGAKRIELAEPNSSRSPAPNRDTGDAATGDEADDAGASGDPAAPFQYESLEVASPGAEETLWNIEGVLNVSLALDPPLQPGHQIRVYYDGEPQIVTSTSFQLQEVWRGVHNLQAEVLDETGNMMIRSPTNRFYVQQTSVRR